MFTFYSNHLHKWNDIEDNNNLFIIIPSPFICKPAYPFPGWSRPQYRIHPGQTIAAMIQITVHPRIQTYREFRVISHLILHVSRPTLTREDIFLLTEKGCLPGPLSLWGDSACYYTTVQPLNNDQVNANLKWIETWFRFQMSSFVRL